MRSILVAGIVGITVGVTVARPAAVWGLYHQIYPSDAAQQQALDQCFREDQGFNRLDPVAREACYVRHQAALRNPAAASDLVPRANYVDLRRAAGDGHAQQSDIRTEQQNDRYLHPAAGHPATGRAR